MKKFRVLNIVDSRMAITNQRVALIELVEVNFANISIPLGLEPYFFGAKGETFVIDFSSSLVRTIMQSAQNEEIVDIDMECYHCRTEITDKGLQNIYYHNNVKLLKDNTSNIFPSFTAEKINGEIHLNFEGEFSIAGIDVALKDICIYLRNQVLMKHTLTGGSNGYIHILVDKYSRELSHYEKSLIEMRMLPINEVTMDCEGFSIGDIQELMHQIQNHLPDRVKKRFLYSVDFKNLLVDEL